MLSFLPGAPHSLLGPAVLSQCLPKNNPMQPAALSARYDRAVFSVIFGSWGLHLLLPIFIPVSLFLQLFCPL